VLCVRRRARGNRRRDSVEFRFETLKVIFDTATDRGDLDQRAADFASRL
jgi:hypothetical protein